MTATQIAKMNKPFAGSTLTPAKIDALICSSYNLHIQQGEALTPMAAAKLPRGDRAQLRNILREKGGSDLYSKAQANEAFQLIVSRAA